MIGAHIGFAGAVWTGRPHLQVLAPTLPMFYHNSDVEMRARAARYFGAAKKALRALNKYYSTEIPLIKSISRGPDDQLAFPYPNSFSLEGSVTQKFEYLGYVNVGKLIFKGRGNGENICIKFVRQYSKEAHCLCQSMGFAPALRGFETVCGGWIMVVMDLLGNEYVELGALNSLDAFEKEIRRNLQEEIRRKLEQLHQHSYAHGDIRSTNIMVKKTGEDRVMLVDFDWAGRIGEVRYPMNMNTKIARPAGVYGGELIMANHDMEAVDLMYLSG